MNKPNILFLFPDQWRWDWMSYNKELPLRTPNLDNLMENGTTFNRCYTSSPVCAPARACLASGLDYNRSPAPNNKCDYDLSIPTFYQYLRDNEYRVAGVGKFDLHKDVSAELDWHLDGSRLLKEWGFTDGIDNEGKFDGSSSYRKANGPKGPYLNFLHNEGIANTYVGEHVNMGGNKGAYVTQLSDQQYCYNWLSKNGLDIIKNFPQNQPWFMQVNFTGPHNPMDVTQSMHDKWKDIDFPPPHNNEQEKYSDEDHLRNRQHYAAMIENIDAKIGAFVDLLKERGEYENTLIVFSSDHGEMLGDHSKWGKSTWREASVHIPLVISGPGIQKNQWSEELVVLHDLANTFLDVSGSKLLPDTDSKSLAPLFNGSANKHREHVLTGLNQWRSIITQDYKYVEGFTDDKEILIDLKNDPWEDSNINSEQSDIISKLKELL